MSELPEPSIDKRGRTLVPTRFISPSIRLIVTGCPRSGTQYAANLFNDKLGTPAEHEYMFQFQSHMHETDKLVEVSCYAPYHVDAIEDSGVPVVHQVRDPCACVNSMMVNFAMISNQFSVHGMKLSLLRSYMQLWVEWNERIINELKPKYFWKLEDQNQMKAGLRKLQADGVLTLPNGVPHSLKMKKEKRNHRQEVDPYITPQNLCHEAKIMARYFGYEY